MAKNLISKWQLSDTCTTLSDQYHFSLRSNRCREHYRIQNDNLHIYSLPYLWKLYATRAMPLIKLGQGPQ